MPTKQNQAGASPEAKRVRDENISGTLFLITLSDF